MLQQQQQQTPAPPAAVACRIADRLSQDVPRCVSVRDEARPAGGACTCSLALAEALHRSASRRHAREGVHLTMQAWQAAVAAARRLRCLLLLLATRMGGRLRLECLRTWCAYRRGRMRQRAVARRAQGYAICILRARGRAALSLWLSAALSRPACSSASRTQSEGAGEGGAREGLQVRRNNGQQHECEEEAGGVSALKQVLTQSRDQMPLR